MFFFNQSNGDQESIVSTRDFVMNFFNFLTNQEFRSINQMFFFDRSNRNRESIESSRNFKMNLLNISIDREIPLIDRMNCFMNFH